jgi:hypothetical protein
MEAAARAVVTRRMAQVAEVTLAELRRQHPAVGELALDSTRVGVVAAQALADPAFLTRLRLLALPAATIEVVAPTQAPTAPPAPSRLGTPTDPEEAHPPDHAADEAAADGADAWPGTAWQR